MVVAGIALPNFGKSFGGFQLKETAQHLMYIMRYAQSRAVIKGRIHRLEFEPDFSKYWITSSPDDLPVEEAGNFERVPNRLGRKFSIPDNIEAESLKQTVWFDQSGNIDKVRIYLCRSERCFTVSTQEQSGYVQTYNEKIE